MHQYAGLEEVLIGPRQHLTAAEGTVDVGVLLLPLVLPTSPHLSLSLSLPASSLPSSHLKHTHTNVSSYMLYVLIALHWLLIPWRHNIQDSGFDLTSDARDDLGRIHR